ncbi:MAG: hypothetical protein BAA01_03015 [Bacillus thermozeamaize]|uniref:Uncharacterized protein n=1 Tax=Bacillus thermozeamaize TaxID=230954 RepID=A0A1Y3PCK3_9BACI|nr:MAG: hypothetical protein BAA01_03015 [Bacillus thermozeamaize]
MYRSLFFAVVSVMLTTLHLYWKNGYLMWAAVFIAMSSFGFALLELDENFVGDKARKRKWHHFVPLVSIGIAGYEAFILYLAEKAGIG